MIVRAITIPVADVVEGGAWKDFTSAAWKGIREACLLANKISQRLFAMDPGMGPDGKLLKWPKDPPMATTAYRLSRELAPDTHSKFSGTVAKTASDSYYRKRLAVWRGTESLTSWRSMPIPFLSVNVKMSREPEGQRRALVRLKMPGGEFMTVALRGGSGFRKQHAAFDAMLDGRFEFRAAELLPHGKNGALAMKLVFKREVPKAHEKKPRDLVVRTAADCLLIARVRGDSWNAQRWNRLDLLGWIASHKRWLRAMGEDSKADGRAVNRKAKTDAKCEKHRRRLKTALQQVAAGVVGIAIRRGCGRVVFDDSCREWCESFPWFQLRQAMESAGAGKGVEVVDVGEANKSATVGDLAALDQVLAAMLERTQDADGNAGSEANRTVSA
jgi:hypothetical protein